MTVSISFIYTGVNFNTQPSMLHENYGRQSIYNISSQPCPALLSLPSPPWHCHHRATAMGLGLQGRRGHHNHVGLT